MLLYLIFKLAKLYHKLNMEILYKMVILITVLKLHFHQIMFPRTFSREYNLFITNFMSASERSLQRVKVKVRLYVCLIGHQNMKVCRLVEVKLIKF